MNMRQGGREERHLTVNQAGSAHAGSNPALGTNLPERRTICTLCGGRCDRGCYTCSHCKRLLWQEIADAQAVDVWRAAYGEAP